MEIILALFIALRLITYIVIFDVILSWLHIFWLKLRPKFVADIIDPLYKNVKNIIPTSFWPLDFTPIIIILLIFFIEWLLIILFPEVTYEINSLIN